MIYFFDKNLQILERKNEISFSFAKKANKEGGGKIEVEDFPHRDSVYISIYEANTRGRGNNNYIASGFIEEIEMGAKSVSITFSTFEGLLKNNKLPKMFSNFDGITQMEVFSNLFYSFVPIIKSKKKDFSNITNGYAVNANFAQGVLSSEHIAFAKVKDGDLHLSFQSQTSEDNAENVFRYETSGSIIFWFDLGSPCEYKSLIRDEIIYGVPHTVIGYAKRYLRFTASLGSKTIINVKAIEQDSEFLNNYESIEKCKRMLNESSYLPFNRGIKDFEKTVGVELPSSKRYLAIQFIFIYEKPDFIQDFSTLEVYGSDGALQKRTVRGFTPVLHGFEILNRRAIAPFAFNKRQTFRFYEEDMEKNLFSHSSTKIKFDGLSLYEALTKFLEATKQNLEIKLIVNKFFNGHLSIKVSKYDFNMTRINKGVAEYIDETHILRLHEKEASRLNNYILKTIKKKTQFPKMLHYYGEGEGQDVLHVCLFNEVTKTQEGNLEEELKLYSLIKIEENTAEGKLLNELKIIQTNILPDLSFSEERVEDSNIKDFNTLLTKAKEHFVEEKKKENYSFEIDSPLNMNLYDQVLLFHQPSKLELKANIVEVKISEKSSKLQKTYGVGGFLFNPFDCFFQKPQIAEVISTPLSPFNVRAFTQRQHLNVVWDCLGVNDGYVIEVKRLDGNIFSNVRRQQEAFFYSINTEIDLSSFDTKTLYVLSVYSYIGNVKSRPSASIYFKISEGILPIRILQSLNEKGSEEGEHGFYLDVEYRNNASVQKELCDILGLSGQVGLKRLKEANDKSEGLFHSLIINGLDEEKEKVFRFLGFEYVWQKGKWVDVRFRLPRHAPLVYLNFRKENITKNYPEKDAKALHNYFYILKRYEQARQLLNYLSTHYQLPAPRNNGIPNEYFSLGNGGDWNPPVNPPVNPPKPPKPPDDPITPPSPDPPGNEYPDPRRKPSTEIQDLWDETLGEYNETKEKLEKLQVNINSFEGVIFDLSHGRNDMEFNTPLFDIFRNEREEMIGGLKGSKSFLDGAFRFVWQSTITDGYFAWQKTKPFFRIKSLIGYTNNEFFYDDVHTLSFWLYVERLKGEVELWNVKNYNIGFIKDGVLHFGVKDDKGVFHTLYKKELKEQYVEDPYLATSKTHYIHIMVIAKKKETVISHHASQTEVFQKIYIDFNEVAPNDYENKTRSVEFDGFVASTDIDFSVFNFKELKRRDEDYSEYIDHLHKIFSPPYRRSTFFDVRLSHLLLFGYDLDYGERQFIKKSVTYPIKEERKEAKKPSQDVTQGKITEDSKYKGVCVSDVDPAKNQVKIYEKGNVDFNADDFFLMGRNEGNFKAGTLYSWTGSSWQALTPYSLYHKEYVMAYSDIVKMKELLSDIFLKDFIINTLQISDILYSKTMQTNSLTVQEGFFLNGIKEEDTHVEGEVYQKGGRLLISQG